MAILYISIGRTDRRWKEAEWRESRQRSFAWKSHPQTMAKENAALGDTSEEKTYFVLKTNL